MNRFLYSFLAAITLTGMQSCKKDNIDTYQAGNYVQFTADSTVYPFFGKASTITQDTVNIAVKLLGKVADHNREINLQVNDSSTATEGTHFTILRPVLLMKDSTVATARVILKRTADLTTRSRTLWVSLKNSDELMMATFDNNYRTAFKLRFSDQLEKPSWWASYFYSYTYSVTRMLFYIDVMGSAASPATFVSVVNVLYKLRIATLEYNATHATPLSDENGLIQWNLDWTEY